MTEAATAPRPPEPPQRASFGWRVAGALVRRREASIGVVLLGLVVYFSLRTDAFFGQENARVIAEFSAPIAIIVRARSRLVALDVVHDVLDAADLLRLLVRDLHVVLFLERHH